MTVIAREDHPLSVDLTDDLADMVGPDNNRSDVWGRGVSIMCPIPSQIVFPAGDTHDMAHVAAAPGDAVTVRRTATNALVTLRRIIMPVP